MVAIAKTKAEYLVGEIVKNWIDGEPATGSGPISAQFEHVCLVNWQRGYELDSWKFSQLAKWMDGHHHITETIVAVFRAKQEGNGK